MDFGSTVTFKNLHDLIAKTVAKIGLDNTIQLLESIVSGKSRTTLGKAESRRLLIQYILSRCIQAFDLDEDLFNTSSEREYREARMVLFHLLRNYTDSSYSSIAQHFSHKKRNVIYAVQKCDEILSVGQFHKDFTGKYNGLKSMTLDFIAKLNSQNTYESSKQQGTDD